MRKQTLFAVVILLLCLPFASHAQNNNSRPSAQATPAPQGARPQPTPAQQQRPRPATSFDITDYGVRIEPEPRLIVMMAALDAAGWDPTPKGANASVFRQTVRKDQESLDPLLRRRMQDFYERNKLPTTATAAEQAARYVSLAYTLGPAPYFEAPPRSEDLPGGVLEVLDFVPLMREFYRASGMDERLPRYVRMHQEEGNRLRRPTTAMVQAVLSYLHTRPELSIIETIRAAEPAKDSKKKPAERRAPLVREKERRFLVTPDLLAAPGTINFRVIRDDYHVIAPFDADPASSEMRRGYIQYVVDPLILRFGKAISAKRPAIKQLLDEQRQRGGDITPDAFLALTRSLVIAADTRIELTGRLGELQQRTAARLRAAKDETARAAIIKESQDERTRIEDDAVARLAEAYERGAVLSFHFSDQLRGLETSGFDISNFFADMVAAIDPVREGRRLAESAEAVKRQREARERARAEGQREVSVDNPETSAQRAVLVKSLGEVDELLRLKNHTEAEARLRALQKQHPEDPRVYFGLAQAANLSAQDAFDPTLQEQRLKLALDFYQQSIAVASPDTHAALISRAHATSGRILAHLERNAEAAREFDAAIRLGDVKGGAYREAVAEKQKLNPQP